MFTNEVETSCPCRCCLLPSATDCKSYFLCFEHQLYERKCEDGELFNPILENCDYEDRVVCQTATPSPILFECPQAHGLFSNPNDCGSFYQCSNHIPYLHQCPAKLHFSKEKQRCEYPKDAKCKNNSETTTDDVTSSVQPDSDQNCTGQDGMFPHNENNTLYLQCEDWSAKIRSCPPDTVYNYANWICTINKTELTP